MPCTFKKYLYICSAQFKHQNENRFLHNNILPIGTNYQRMALGVPVQPLVFLYSIGSFILNHHGEKN